ncbi:MAG: hypothetical protein ACLQF0_14900 [Dissulfurispiraceae bacterium]
MREFYRTLLVGSIRKRGFFGTLVFIFFEFYFDLRYGTNTTGVVEVDDLNIGATDRKNAYKYQAANYYILQKLLTTLKMDFGDSVLIDFGSGKGRVLLVALEYGFKRLIGVEISQALCAICEDNLRIYRRNKKKYDATKVEISNIDAAKYPIPDDADIFFFYNPFGEEVFIKVIDNIEESLRLHRRSIYILYINPVFRDVLENKGFHCLLDLHREAVIFIKDG